MKNVCLALEQFRVRRSTRCSTVLAVGLLLALGTTILAGSASAQSSKRAVTSAEWSLIVSAARKEGKVVGYVTTAPVQHARIKADFEKVYPGIMFEPVRLPGASGSVKLDQERLIPNIDGGDVVITVEMDWSVEAAKNGWLKTPVGPSAQTWPDAYIKQGVVPLLGINLIVLSYNTKLVKNPPAGYQDLLKPEFKGKISMPSLASDAIIGFYEWLEKTQGVGFLEKLAAQDVRMHPGAVPSTQAVASGELLTNTWTVHAVVTPLVDTGAPLKMVVPTPSYGVSYAGGIVNWSKRPNAALVFMDYMMSVRGQSMLIGNGELSSPLPGVPGSLDVKSATLFDGEKYSADVRNAYTEKWNRIFRAK